MADYIVEKVLDILIDARNRNLTMGSILHSECRYFASTLVKNDVVPVVRCKDCKHMHCYTDYTTKEKTYNCLKYGALNFVEGDHYCAYGEREDDNAK